jgi:hypothetical protein
VKLIRLKNESDEISSVTKIERDPEEENVAGEEGGPAEGTNDQTTTEENTSN